MDKLQNALDYFLQYEWSKRYQNITLNKEGDQLINISNAQLSDIYQMKEILWARKLEILVRIVNHIKIKEPYKVQELLKEIQVAFAEKKDETDFSAIEGILTEACYQFPKNRGGDIEKIKQVLADDRVMLLYPILAREKKKIPLICFTLKLEEQLQVESYSLQKEVLRTVIAEIIGCDIADVEILVEDFEEFYLSLLELECKDIFSIIKIIEEQLTGKFNSGFNGLWKFKDYQNWAITEEIIITLEAFDDLMFPVFQDEIKEVRIHCAEKKSSLLEQYLFGSNERIKVEQQPLKFYYGSYAKEYSVNFKQSKVVSAYRDSELLAVNGPPGTGKTTVLKEIIADNLVRKTELLVEKWEESWVSMGSGNQQVYCSPLGGACDYSMVITSFNNKAVDNIGIELLKELDFFSELTDKEEGNKGVVCARLGKIDNMRNFRHQFLQPLIQRLGNISNESDINNQLEEESDSLSSWKITVEQLKDYEKAINAFVTKRNIVNHELENTGMIAGKITEDKVTIAKDRIEKELVDLAIEIKQMLCEVGILKERSLHKGNEFVALNEKIQEEHSKKEETRSYINEINKKKGCFIIGPYLAAMASKKLGSVEELEKREADIAQNIEVMTQLKISNKEEYDKMTECIARIQQTVEEKQQLMAQKQALSEVIAEFSILMQELYVISEKFGVRLNWDFSIYEYYHHPEITKKRYQLFKMSLKITELYIKKHGDEIRFNLEKIYPNQWFQPFYRPDFRYDKAYTMYLKSVWETLFLCFPVVTTTLSALDKRKFPMINGIFDTVMMDEAGQALLHTAVGPLYRFRKAIMVGDVFQLEPIRGQKEKLIEKYNFTQEEKAKLDVEENSIQHAADRGSNVYDFMSQKEVGIVLTEHRRCERAIVQFSNQMVYNNNLTVIKDNEDKPFLDKNLCMIDVRGIKNKRNENLSEVNICKRVIKELVEIYGAEYKEKIGIITPYRHQAELLGKEIPGIISGTVHAFQGQEKEIILLSLAIDSSQSYSGANFVGDKSNFLNVAFTRAKKQLILIGNYEACERACNYLKDAIEIIKSQGRIYSLYDSELAELIVAEAPSSRQFLKIMADYPDDLSYSHLLGKHLNNGLLSESHKHYLFLREAIKVASNSIHIVSPWIMPSVVNKDFLEDIRQFIGRNGKVEICFGYNKTHYSLSEIDKIVEKDNFGSYSEKTIQAIQELHTLLNNNLSYTPPIHTKVLIIDEKFMILGSHNWLSNKGAYKNSKDELSCLVCDPEAIQFVIRRYYD